MNYSSSSLETFTFFTLQLKFLRNGSEVQQTLDCLYSITQWPRADLKLMERSRLALSLTMLSSSWRPASTPSSSWPPASSRLPSSPLDGLMLNTRTTNQNKDFLGWIPFWGFHFLGGGSILGGVPFLGGFHLMFSCTSLEGANASWFVWYKISKFKIYRNGYSSIIAHLALQTMCFWVWIPASCHILNCILNPWTLMWGTLRLYKNCISLKC